MEKYYCCICKKEIVDETKIVDMELDERGNIIFKDSTYDGGDILNFCSFDCLYNYLNKISPRR